MRGAGDVTGGMCTLLLAFAFLVAGLYWAPIGGWSRALLDTSYGGGGGWEDSSRAGFRASGRRRLEFSAVNI